MARRKSSDSPQPPLSEAVIVEAALGLVDREGFEALTMRRLAAGLGVDPMALYYHVPGKETLVRLLVERVFRELPPVRRKSPWRQRVHAWAGSYHAIVAAHPNLLRPMLTNASAVAAALAANRELFAALEAGGLPPRVASHGAGVIADFLHGFMLAASALPDDDERYFSFALDVILDGLEARRD